MPTATATRGPVRKKQTGEAGNGGQFGHTRRAESDVSIDTGARKSATGDSRCRSALEELGVPADGQLGQQVRAAWRNRFAGRGLESMSGEDRAILRGDLPPWRVLASKDDLELADHATSTYRAQRAQMQPQMDGAKQFFEMSDDVLVDLGHQDRRATWRQRAMTGTMIAMSLIPMPYRRYAQVVFNAGLTVRQITSRAPSAGEIQQQTVTVLQQQQQARAEVEEMQAQAEKGRREAARAHWQAGLPRGMRTASRSDDGLAWADRTSGVDPGDFDELDSELDVAID